MFPSDTDLTVHIKVRLYDQSFRHSIWLSFWWKTVIVQTCKRAFREVEQHYLYVNVYVYYVIITAWSHGLQVASDV